MTSFQNVGKNLIAAATGQGWLWGEGGCARWQRFAVRRARTMVINGTALPARPHQLELGVISRDQSHAADIQPIFRGDKRALIFALRISRLPAPLPLPTSNG